MASPNNLKDFEKRNRRQVRRIRIGQMLTRYYEVPIDAASTLEPARGTVMPGESDTVTAPRAKHTRYEQSQKDGFIWLVVDWVQPQAY